MQLNLLENNMDLTLENWINIINIIVSIVLGFILWYFGHKITKKYNIEQSFNNKWSDYYLRELQQLNNSISKIVILIDSIAEKTSQNNDQWPKIDILDNEKQINLIFNEIKFHKWKMETYLIEIKEDKSNNLSKAMNDIIKWINISFTEKKADNNKISQLQKNLNKAGMEVHYEMIC